MSDNFYIELDAWTLPENRLSLKPIKNLIGEMYLKPISCISMPETNTELSRRLLKLYTDRNNSHSVSRIGHGKGLVENFDILRDLAEQQMFSSAWSFRINFLPALIEPSMISVLDETRAILTLIDEETWST
jgi:hypothetical protein